MEQGPASTTKRVDSWKQTKGRFMKKDSLQLTGWIVGSLAAMMVMGTESMAATQVVTSYNDLAWGTGQLETNITKITSPNGGSGLPSTGNLVDYSTGDQTPVILTVTGGTYDGAANAAQGANPTIGDAFNIFNGIVSGQGIISYTNAVGSNLVLTFTNMDPSKLYDLTFFGHRNSSGWDRASKVRINSAVAFRNTSSFATDNPSEPGGVLFTDQFDDSTRLPSDNDNGYVARFSNIQPGNDGMVFLTIEYDGTTGNEYTGKYASAVRLIETSQGAGGSTSYDFNGDGKADLVWRDTVNGTVAVWLMDGATVISSGITGGVPLNWKIVGLGDVDGDGKSDIVWRNTSDGDVALWLMNGVNIVLVASPGGAPLAWEISQVSDENGDGKSDIVWRNTSDGSVAVWLMNGATIGSVGIPGGAGLVWEIQ